MDKLRQLSSPLTSGLDVALLPQHHVQCGELDDYLASEVVTKTFVNL